jgi:hypothetical protein
MLSTKMNLLCPFNLQLVIVEEKYLKYAIETDLFSLNKMEITDVIIKSNRRYSWYSTLKEL